jgi:hypothetical protein
MKHLLCLVLGLAACGHSKSADTTNNLTATTPPGPDDPSVDPTVPSWAPRSCVAYHKAVVQALACEPVAQARRDEIKAKYDADSDAWRAMHDAEPGKIQEVGLACTGATDSVRGEIVGTCEGAK